MAKERSMSFSDRMSEHEALMWNIEEDPWLNPNGSALTVLDRPIDMERFRRQVRHGVSKIPRLYQRVIPGVGRISTPAWVPDREFDFDNHVVQVQLPAPGSDQQLLELATKLASESLDRERPLWRFVVIDGLDGGRGAVWSLFHHAISDGVGQIRMAELYQQATRDDPGHEDPDLEAIVAAACDPHGKGNHSNGGLSSAVGSLSHLGRRQFGLGRRMLGEVMLWPVDVSRASSTATRFANATINAIEQLTGLSNEKRGGSDLWSKRSGHRNLQWVRVPLDDLKSATKEQGVSINDGFIAGLTNAAVAYHAKRDLQVEAFNTSFVVSTRQDNNVGGNSFTPVVVQVSGDALGIADRCTDVHLATDHARIVASQGGGVGGIAGLANLLPISVVTKTARDQAGKIDFATSNLRGAPFPLYCAGAKVEAVVCMGPVAGTAVNVTAMSYDGHFDMGLMIDPVAIDDPEDFRNCVVDAFERVLVGERGAEQPGGKPSKSKKATMSKNAHSAKASK